MLRMLKRGFFLLTMIALLLFVYFIVQHYHRDGGVMSVVSSEKHLATLQQHGTTLVDKEIVAVRKLVAAGDNRAALRMSETPWLKQSKDPRVLRLRATVLVNCHQTKEAGQLIKTGLASAPDNADLLYAQGYLYYNQKHYGKAKRLLKQHNPSLAEHPDYYGLLAQSCLQLYQPTLSESLYRLLLTSQPDSAQWWLGLALSLQAENHFEKAKFAYQKALNLGHLPVMTMAYIKQQLQKHVTGPAI
jgi:tetratricopeptide (TPR) repeat protein